MSGFNYIIENGYFIGNDSKKLSDKLIDTISDLLLQNEAVGVVCGYHDKDFPIYFYSDAVGKMLGYTDLDIKLSNINKASDIIYEKDLCLFNHQSIDNQTEREFRLKTKDNNLVWVHDITTTVTDIDGKKMWVSSLRKIDKFKKLRIQSDLLMLSIAAKYLCIYQLDLFEEEIQCIFSRNKKLISKTFPYEDEITYLGKGFTDMEKERLKIFFNKNRIKKEIENNQTYQEETFTTILDGKKMVLKYTLEYHKEIEKRNLVTFTSRDITSEHISNEALEIIKNDYEEIIYLDLENDHFHTIYPLSKIDEKGTYSTAIINRLAKSIIKKSDYQIAKNLLNKDNIIKNNTLNGKTIGHYNRWHNDSFKLHEIIITPIDENDLTKCIFTIRNIEQTVKLANVDKRFKALIDLYEIAIEVNLKTFECEYYKNALDDTLSYKVNKNIYQILDYYEYRIHKDDLKIYLKNLAIDNIINTLKDKNSFNFNIRILNSGIFNYYSFEIIKLDNLEKILILIKQTSNINYLENVNETNLNLSLALKAEVLKNKAKDEYLSHMNHDLRTPMNAIIGLSCLADMNKDDPKYLYDILTKIKISSNQLLSLINNILDINKMDNNKLKLVLQPFNLNNLIKELEVLIEPQRKMRNISLSCKTNTLHNNFIGSELHIKEIILNLLSNAVKYNKENGFINLTINEYDKGIKIYVSDTGIGIKNVFLPTLFDYYAQEDNSNSLFKGSGLGLYIVKKLVDLMNGKIDVITKIDMGTTFKIEIPLAYCDEIKKDIETNTYTNINLKILLAEDNIINQEIIKSLLESYQIKVDIANNGKECLDIFINSDINYYDLILMDLRMPIMSGIEATKLIRQSDKKDNNIPIYAITADTYQEDIDLCIESGMNGHFKKPIELDEILSVLYKLKK